MTSALLWLHLAGLARLACLYGFTPREHPSALLPLAPLLLLAMPEPRFRPGAAVSIAIAALGTLALLAFLLGAPAHAWNGPDLWPATALGLASLGTVMAARTGEAEDRGPLPLIWCAAWTVLGAWNAFLPLLGASLAGLSATTGLWRSEAPAEGLAPFRWPRLGAFLMAALMVKPTWDHGLAAEGWWNAGIFLLGGAAMGFALPLLSRPLTRRGQWFLLGSLVLLSSLYHPSGAYGWSLVAGALSGTAWHRRPEGFAARAFALPVLLGVGVSFALHANLWILGLPTLLGWWR